MNYKRFLFIALITLVVSGLVLSLGGQTPASASTTASQTGYKTIWGYEGIATLGAAYSSYGEVPPVGDYVTTHCRYLNVISPSTGHFYLRYPVDLPNGSTITNISLFVADWTSTGALIASLHSKKWDSNDSGNSPVLGTAGTTYAGTGNLTISMTGLGLTVNNQTTQYWVDVSPNLAAGGDPATLCVYGLQVTYAYSGLLVPFAQ